LVPPAPETPPTDPVTPPTDPVKNETVPQENSTQPVDNQTTPYGRNFTFNPDEFFAKFDKDQDGKLSKVEVATAFRSRLGTALSSEELDKAFWIMDKDADGFVSRQELILFY
jgi:Ca2+-binding EF-hand superfamily protein